MYAAKFKLKTTAAVFKIAGKDLGKPIGVRGKSVIGVDENKVPKKGTLKGLLYSEYHLIPETMNNMLRASWKPEYLKLIEKSKDSSELIEYQRRNKKAARGVTGMRLATRSALKQVCGTSEENHIKPLKNLNPRPPCNTRLFEGVGCFGGVTEINKEAYWSKHTSREVASVEKIGSSGN